MKRLAAAALLLLAGCQHNTFLEYESVSPEEFPILTAKGVAPISAQQGKNRDLKAQQAMRAAKLDAYRELAEQIYGVRVSASGRMDQQLLQSDKFQTQVDGLVRGAEVVRIYPVGDNYVAELKLDYRKVWLLYQQAPRHKVKNVIYY